MGDAQYIHFNLKRQQAHSASFLLFWTGLNINISWMAPLHFAASKGHLAKSEFFACRLAERPMYRCIYLSLQQLNNRYWVALKGTICCDKVQLEFEPWTDEASNGEIYFQIKVSHNRKDFVGWLLSFNSKQKPNSLKKLW